MHFEQTKGNTLGAARVFSMVVFLPFFLRGKKGSSPILSILVFSRDAQFLPCIFLFSNETAIWNVYVLMKLKLDKAVCLVESQQNKLVFFLVSTIFYSQD